MTLTVRPGPRMPVWTEDLARGAGVSAPGALFVRQPAAAESGDRQLLRAGEALANGESAGAMRAELQRQGLSAAHVEALTPHEVNPGSRPSTIVLFPGLDPANLGRLIALYEHNVLTQSVVWGISAFDQWGVEPARGSPRSSHRRCRTRAAATWRRPASRGC